MSQEKNRIRIIFILLVAWLVAPFSTATGKNLHLLDESPEGFAVYRSGAPDAEDIKRWCELGIQEVMVLAGNAQKYEEKHLKHCPTLKIIYNTYQTWNVPLTDEFLKFFDHWVALAKKNNKKILFRCNCGCHRAGRLAAYYELKHKKASYETAVSNLYRYGSDMDHYYNLPIQIVAYLDYINSRKCRFSGRDARQYCVRK